MIDTQIELEPRFPFAATLVASGGALLIGLSLLTQDVNWAIGSIPCWTTFIALSLVAQRRFAVSITKEGLDFRESGKLVKYNSIESISFQGKTDKKGDFVRTQVPLIVSHDQGTFVIPAGINVSSHDLYLFLQSRFSPREIHPLNSLLTGFADEQTQTFGSEKVFRFTARRHLKSPSGRPTARVVGLGLMVGAGLMIAAANWLCDGRVQESWIGGGIAVGLAGVITFLVSFATSSSTGAKVKNWQASGIVISPIGIAMVQGPLKGRLLWHELKNVKANQKAASFHVTSSSVLHGILLQIDGSSLVIADVYNQPLATIHAQITRYWRGDGDL